MLCFTRCNRVQSSPSTYTSAWYCAFLLCPWFTLLLFNHRVFYSVSPWHQLVRVGVKPAQGLIHWAPLRVCLNTAHSQGPVRLIHWATLVGRLSVAVITHLLPGHISLAVCAAMPQCSVTLFVFVCLLLRSVRDDFGSVIGKCQGKTLSTCFITLMINGR